MQLGTIAASCWSASALLPDTAVVHTIAILTLDNSLYSQPLSPHLGVFCTHSSHSNQGVILKCPINQSRHCLPQRPPVATRPLSMAAPTRLSFNGSTPGKVHGPFRFLKTPLSEVAPFLLPSFAWTHFCPVLPKLGLLLILLSSLKEAF